MVVTYCATAISLHFRLLKKTQIVRKIYEFAG